ncbi:uncharacterized [Tachysurus ichikawai]
MPCARELMQENTELYYRVKQLGNDKQPPTCTSWRREAMADSLKKIPRVPRLRQLKGRQRGALLRSAMKGKKQKHNVVHAGIVVE